MAKRIKGQKAPKVMLSVRLKKDQADMVRHVASHANVSVTYLFGELVRLGLDALAERLGVDAPGAVMTGKVKP